ncbi:DNA polymerase III subunit delta' [Paraferrimonas sedimenticola]|uniref:DNA-directed DNA polymerase n=1 Tax=Paraferrimonas sedimenticola TaxID=375674 RepID=A0AA37RZU3_9GAMM|nr:DNA polymerase III subunit delta' [Paraferrimonas sedimenticola]GLP98084.1 DNA polymerase III subunit delta' [Paraferrimonas sedimenticola]
MQQPLAPWLEPTLNKLLAQAHEGQLAHALLLPLSKEQGAEVLLNRLLQGLLCLNGNACGQCKSCHLLAAGTHPDAYSIKADGNQIKVDQIRELTSALSKTAQQGGARVAIIWQAEQLNHAAANALLKTLEEPAANCFIVLASAKAGLLPATIRSRCQNVALTQVSKAQSRDWLQNQGVDWNTVGWTYDVLGGPYAMLQQQGQERLEQLQSARKEWSNALAKGQVSATLCQYTQDQPADSLHVLHWLISKKMGSILASQRAFANRLSALISEISQVRQQLAHMPSVNYVALCTRLVLDYQQAAKQ